MKYHLSITLLIISLSVFGQVADNTHLHNDRNIYAQSLLQYLKFRETDSYYSKCKKLDTIYVERDYKITDSLIENLGTTKVILLDKPYDYISNRNWKGLTLYRIYPLTYKNGEFSVSFVPFETSAKKKKRMLYCTNSGSYKVVFKFVNNEFKFIRVEDIGF